MDKEIIIGKEIPEAVIERLRKELATLDKGPRERPKLIPPLRVIQGGKK